MARSLCGCSGDTNANGQSLGSSTLEPSVDSNGNLVLTYPLNATSTATCPNGTASVITFACVAGSLV
jgi:hypothetical protein